MTPARAFLLGAFLYGLLGATLSVYTADATGRMGMLRVGAALVVLAGVAAAGLAVSRPGVQDG